MSKLRVIDVDGHFAEPESMWAEYLEPAYRDMAPRFVTDSKGRTRVMVAGEMKPFIPMEPGTNLFSIPGGHDPKARLACQLRMQGNLRLRYVGNTPVEDR